MVSIVKNGDGNIRKEDEDQVELIQRKLVELIENERYLLVLDDVWNDDELKWEPLQKILNRGANGSRIVVTTRNKGVAHAIRSVHIQDLGLLPNDDCWFIFKKLVFGENNDGQGCKDLEEVGKQIVEKCGGLPLAVKTIASAIRKKARGKQPTRGQLENILNSEIWHVSESNAGILPALMLSYIELPSKLRNCFVYCSLFEKDFIFKKDLLTKLWVAQGYIVANDEQREVEPIAEECFDELLDRSLFQEPGIDKHGNIASCKMHHLVHDLAQWLCTPEFSVMKTKDPKNSFPSLGNARHCAISGELPWKFDIALTGVENLRTLINFFGSFDRCNIGGVIMKQLQSVRVLNLQWVKMREVHGLERLVHLRYLNLSNTDIEVLPKSIGKLKVLRYLDISETKIKRLPKTITSLSQLQMLNLSGCENLTKLPDGILGMGSLRHLDVSWCGNFLKLPDGIGRLTLLQTLGLFRVVAVEGGNGGHSNIGELEGLNRLRGHLSITNLGAVGSGEEARTAKLQDKSSLVSIDLRWEYGASPHPTAVGVLESLHPPHTIEKLRIRSYPGMAFPSWVGDTSFLFLFRVEIWRCENCTQLPPLGQLPCLKSLWIWRLPGVKKVGGEFLHLGLGDDVRGTSAVAFPQLENLTFTAMDCWEQWASPLSSSSPSLSSSIVKKEATADATILPRLRQLWLDGCPKLEGVPPIFTTSLQTLTVENCPALHSLKFLPPSIQRLKLIGVSAEKLLADCPSTHLPSLQHLLISDDSELTDQLPPTILHLANLQSLRIYSCKNLKILPEGLMRVTSLQTLKIHECPKLERVPLIFTTALQTLFIGNCYALSSLQFLPPSIQRLELRGVSTGKLLTDCATTHPALKHLSIIADSELTDQLSPTILHLIGLQSLYISSCKNLRTLPEGLTGLTSLQTLQIHECSPELSESCKVGGRLWPRIAHIPGIEIDSEVVQNKAS